MAHEWYVQQGGKQYGPLTAANLKKLAAEGKITPATTVRLGSEGTWVAAARVQGLFAAKATTPPLASNPPAGPATTPPQPPKAVVPPVAPPVASPLARPASGSFGSLPKAAPIDGGSMPAKILGAVALVLGTLALATFWLPSNPAFLGPMGWTGIVVGALGLLIGIAGFVLSAMHKGAGLYLNVAGTASSLVGLVLTIVFGVVAGMFTGTAPPKTVAMIPVPAPAQAVPEPQLPPAEEPKPEPPPEPVWTPASEAIEQGDIKARITSSKIEQVRLESTDLSRMNKREKPRPMLKIRVEIENTSSDKIVEVPGWVGGGDLIGQGVGELLGGEAGKAVAAATATATLVDNVGNKYKQTPMISLFGVQLNPDVAVRPGQKSEKDLVFPPPLASVEYLRLELSSGGFSGSEPLRFEIPKSMIEGL